MSQTTCPDDSLFAAWLEGSLAPPERDALDAHTDTCPACAQLVVELARLLAPLETTHQATRHDAPHALRAPLEEKEAAPPLPPLPLPGARLGRYQIGALLGRGGMGAVLEATDAQTGQQLAIKLLRHEEHDPAKRAAYAARLTREGLLMRRISHPNVLPVYNISQQDGQLCVAMMRVRGCPMHTWIARAKPTWRERLARYIAAGEGLAAAHAAGVIHRDVKPSNILVGDEGGVWVADFGLARAFASEQATAADADPLSSLTGSGVILGTPAYMAPEQHMGQPVDARADQLSFCAALFEGLHGIKPFAGERPQEIALNACAGRISAPPPGPIPAALHAVICRGLSAQPSARFEDMTALLDALRRALSGASSARGGAWRPPADAFVGRDALLSALERELTRGDAAQLVLIGTAGAGKSRLSREVAARAAWAFDAVIWCPLEEACAPEDVPRALARALELPLVQRDHVGQLSDALRGLGRALILFDGAERAHEATQAACARWMQDAPAARHLITTRRRWPDAPARHQHQLGALSHPDADALDPSEIASHEAVALLRARAERARGSALPWDAHTAAQVARLVHMLDGLPLAIELAAARMRVLTPEQIAARMDRRFALLRAPGATRDRHSALEDALAWSWELLDAQEQRALATLAVCEGGFDVACAEALLEPEGADVMALDLLDALTAHSLLQLTHDAPPRLMMLASVQAFARARLAEQPTLERAARDAHARFFAALGTLQAQEALSSHDGAQRKRALALERENLRAALDHASASQDHTLTPPLLMALTSLIKLIGPYDAADPLLSAALSAPQLSAHDRATLQERRGSMRRLAGDMSGAFEDLSAALELALALHDQRTACLALGQLALSSQIIGETALARERFERAIALAQARGDKRLLSAWTGELAIVASNTGALEEARAGYERALQLAIEAGDQELEGSWRANLAAQARLRGDMEAARSGFERALQLAIIQGDRGAEAARVNMVAALEHSMGAIASAREGYDRAVALSRMMGRRRAVCNALGNRANLSRELGHLAHARDDYDEALALSRELQQPKLEAAWLLNKAGLELTEDRPDEARALYHASLALIDTYNFIAYEVHVRVGLARVDLACDAPHSALTQIERALALSAQLGITAETAEWAVTHAEILMKLERPHEALSLLQEAEPSLRANKDILAIAELLCTDASLKLHLSRVEEAHERAREAAQHIDALHLTAQAPLRRQLDALQARLRRAAEVRQPLS